MLLSTHLHFDDEQHVLALSSAIPPDTAQLTLTFGETIHFDWTPLPQLPLQSFTLELSPYNDLSQRDAFPRFLSALPPSLRQLSLHISAYNDINEQIHLAIAQSLSNFPNLTHLTYHIHDTRHLTQQAFDALSQTIAQMKSLTFLRLNLGYSPLNMPSNNHQIRSYASFYEANRALSISTLEVVLANNHLNFVSQALLDALAQNSSLKSLSVDCKRGSPIQKDSFQPFKILNTLDSLSLTFAESSDLSDDDIYEILVQLTPTEGSKIKIASGQKILHLKGLSLLLSTGQTQNISTLLGKLQRTLSTLKQLHVNIQTMGSSVYFEEKCIPLIEQSNLKVLKLSVKKVNGFQCCQFINFFADCLRVKKWYFISVEIPQKTILQLYSKRQENVYVNAQINAGLKLGLQGEESLARAFTAVNICKLRLTILNENQLSEKGFKLITNAIFGSTYLEKATFQISDSNTSVHQFIMKMQATVNQFIKDKQRLTKTYCALLQREFEKFKDQFSLEMIAGVSDFILEDVTLPNAGQNQNYYGGQFGFGSGLNPGGLETFI